MKLNKNTKILIVGLGLLGGSYAMALTRQGYSVSAITLDPDSVSYAEEKGIIAYGTTTVEPDVVAGAELVIFALYPHVFVDWLKQYQHLFSPGTILTDVTGVKTCIVYDIQSFLRPDVEFIAAHPMAGREVYGVQNSDDRIFRGANYIVVPTEKNTPGAIALCRALGQTLGFHTVAQLTPEEHDEMIAFLSQLTHGIAVCLMCCNNTPGLENYTGDSFRDLTRIARINDDMWSELFLLNRDALLHEMQQFRQSFDRLYACLEQNDREGMREMMRLSTARRARFDKNQD